ncbi:MAG: hypothetical protein AAB739_01980 [Patescibacteria group bacterium]
METEVEVETVPLSLAAELKGLLKDDDGENGVRAKVDDILSRRGAHDANPGEQTALRSSMDELEEDPSDEAGKVLNIIFGRFDAAELAREKAFPLKSSIEPTDETPGSLTNLTFEAIARTVPQDDRPKRPDCDD